MRIRVLGAAAGGGFPQWNCACPNCRALRAGRFAGLSRSQAQLAISTDDANWYLLNASPDLRYQIESFPALHPAAGGSIRNSPVSGIILPSAEVDAALGLLLLRESQPLNVYATPAVRTILTSDNSLFGVLRRQPGQVTWIDLQPDNPFELGNSGIICHPISTGAGFPGFVSPDRASELNRSEAVLGFLLKHRSRTAAIFPGLESISPELLSNFESCDALFIDGTFWSNDELIRLQGPGSKTAREMGHQPVEQTIEILRTVKGRKLFFHINNTNPMLDENSRQFHLLREAGWELAFDGMDVLV